MERRYRRPSEKGLTYSPPCSCPNCVRSGGTKKAAAKLDLRERIELAQQLVQVARADVESAEAQLAQAREELAKYQAQVDRWDVQVKRLKREVDQGVVERQVLHEPQNQWEASTAALTAAKATSRTAQADLLSRTAHGMGRDRDRCRSLNSRGRERGRPGPRRLVGPSDSPCTIRWSDRRRA